MMAAARRAWPSSASRNMSSHMATYPAQRPLALANCCGRFMGVAETPAPDPESLMRSRYSAFVLERADYLLATWHPRTRPAQLEFEPGARWLGLAVKRHQSTGADAAVVEFVARYRVGGKAVRLHEVSRAGEAAKPLAVAAAPPQLSEIARR